MIPSPPFNILIQWKVRFFRNLKKKNFSKGLTMQINFQSSLIMFTQGADIFGLGCI